MLSAAELLIADSGRSCLAAASGCSGLLHHEREEVTCAVDGEPRVAASLVQSLAGSRCTAAGAAS